MSTTQSTLSQESPHLMPPHLTPRAVLGLLQQTWAEWNEDKVPRLSAAFAYYTVFSLAPLLVVILAIVGRIYGDEAARGELVAQISGSGIGPQAAEAIQGMIKGAGERKSTGLFASIAGIVTLLLGSSALFGQLQDSLNTIWEVAPRPNLGWMNMVRQRFLSFSMVLGCGFLLLVSLALSAAVAALGHFIEGRLPLPEWALQALNLGIGFFVTTLLFAMIYKVLPDAEVEWRDVWVGAAITALLFGLGRFALGLYLGKSGVSSAYGAAGSLVLILLWVYYAAQILFFGAEFTQVFANSYGSKVRPSDHAIPVTDEMRSQQGLPRLSDLQSTEIAKDSHEKGKPIRAASQSWQGNQRMKDEGARMKTAPQSTADAVQIPADTVQSTAEPSKKRGPIDTEYFGAAALAFVATLVLSAWRRKTARADVQEDED